jgi:hypothetical protein
VGLPVRVTPCYAVSEQRRAAGKRKLFFDLASGEKGRQTVLAFAGGDLKAAAE